MVFKKIKKVRKIKERVLIFHEVACRLFSFEALQCLLKFAYFCNFIVF